MTWNYRVIKSEQAKGYFDYTIHEVHYGPRGGIDGWSVRDVAPFGETAEELKDDIHMMAQAFAHPILEEHNGKLREVK